LILSLKFYFRTKVIKKLTI